MRKLKKWRDIAEMSKLFSFFSIFSFQLPILFFTIVLTACSGGGAGNPVVTTPPTIVPESPAPVQATASPTPQATPSQAAPQPELPLSQYSLSTVLDYDLHHLTVEEKIHYVNHASEPLPDLLLLVEPNRFLGGFTLTQITWEDGSPVSGYTLSGPELRLPLAQPLQPEASLNLSLSYELNLPQQPAPFGYTERQANLGDWYPYAPPYTPGEGWLVRADADYGEHLAYDMADFQVEIRLARPSAATGEPLTVAASALPQIEGDTYRYHLAPARNFAWSVSPLYQVESATVDDITVTAYSFPFHPTADEPALLGTAKALSTFNELFSPYPHDSLSVVEADFLDGMEYDGLIFLSHAFYDFYPGDQKSNLALIAAHEVAHQWWYGLVGNDQADEPWLDEALSTYSELLFYEKVYPDLADWWWQNRIYFHKPEGWVDNPIYGYGPNDFYPYRNAVYLRGAQFLGELRQSMGDQAFFDFLHDYLERFSYRQATGDDFFALLAKHTSADLSSLIDAYFANR